MKGPIHRVSDIGDGGVASADGIKHTRYPETGLLLRKTFPAELHPPVSLKRHYRRNIHLNSLHAIDSD